jgi:hypothetical protein
MEEEDDTKNYGIVAIKIATLTVLLVDHGNTCSCEILEFDIEHSSRYESVNSPNSEMGLGLITLIKNTSGKWSVGQSE